MVNITFAEVITTTVMFGIVHAIWSAIKWSLRQLKTDTGKTIHKHVTDGHHMRLTRCYTGACARFRTGLDSLRSEE